MSSEKEEVLSIAGFLKELTHPFIHSLILSSFHLILLLPAWCLDLTAGLCLSYVTFLSLCLPCSSSLAFFFPGDIFCARPTLEGDGPTAITVGSDEPGNRTSRVRIHWLDSRLLVLPNWGG